jgi:electron transfer flavoprotein beta subunit
MKAKKKQMEIATPESLGVDVTSRLKTLRVFEPSKRTGGIKVSNVADLLNRLRNEAKVIE